MCILDFVKDPAPITVEPFSAGPAGSHITPDTQWANH